ncbi:MAG: flagellar biosynthesis protein FlhB [bacterium]
MGDEDKQFEASAQKLKKARDEGQVVKSKDLSMAISLLVMFQVVSAMGPFIWGQISKLFITLFNEIPHKHLEEIGIPYILYTTIIPMVLILAPLLMVAAFIAILSDIIQVGPLITLSPLMPKLDKINPFKGIKNIFSMKTVIELVKNIIKVVALGYIGYITYVTHIPIILKLCTTENTFSILLEFGKILVDFVTKAGMLFLIIAGGDYMYTRFKFLKDQKMSFKEVKDEYKNSEGDPHVKQALRQKRMQMLQKNMLDSVPQADFITTNPIHVAVAVKYDNENMRAPKVIAKGSELFAKKIIEIAKKHNIPVIENPPVARALFKLVDINREIPPELYKAVAEILMFVYNLRKTPESNIM